jgi:adenylate cyclase
MDMVGYSRLIGLDDVGTLDRLRVLRRDVIDSAIEEHGGRLVNTGGDSLLIVFDSIDGAVRCSVKMQQQIPVRDLGHPDDRAIRFRIGINIGDAIADGTDLHGDAVNVAVRLQAECPSGAVCVSRSVRDHVHGRLDLAFEARGLLHLKNIARPVEAFVVKLDAGSHADRPPAADAGEQALTLPDKPSLAVLPFTNMSGDAEQEYFVDGLVDDITTALARVSWFFVIARNSSFTYKGRAADVRQVGRELGVRYVLEGSVRRAGNRVRITGQLVDATSAAHLWADRFEGDLEDIFDLQDKITASVAGAIEPKLLQAEILRARTKPTESLSAYDLYLRALGMLYEYTETSTAAVQVLLDQAIAADPHYAAAYALAAWCLNGRVEHGWSADEASWARAVRLARLALEHGRDDPFALAVGGLVIAMRGGHVAEGLAHIEHALKLNPNAARAWELCGRVCSRLGQHGRSIECFEKAMRLSPLDPMAVWQYVGIAWPYFLTGRHDEAIAWADKAARVMPNISQPWRIMLAAGALAGRDEVVEQALRRLRDIVPDVSIAKLLGTNRFRPKDQFEYYEAALRKAGVPE